MNEYISRKVVALGIEKRVDKESTINEIRRKAKGEQAVEVRHLLVFEKMKNEDARGIGCFLVAMLNSESLLGLAVTPSSSISISEDRHCALRD